MELILLGLLLCGWLDGDNKNSSKRERYWEDAHWWSLNR